jgi:hypothetical protein
MTPFEASLMSLDSSGFTCAPAPALVSQRVPAHVTFSEPAARVANDDAVVREAVAVFHSPDDLQNAIDKLFAFRLSSLSVDFAGQRGGGGRQARPRVPQNERSRCRSGGAAHRIRVT